MDGETEQSAFDELVEMERQSGLEAPEIPPGVDTEIMRQPLVYEDPAEPATRKVEEVTANVHPLKIVSAGSGDYRVVMGTVAGLDDPFSPGDSPVFELTVTDGHYVYVELTVAYDTGTSLWNATALDILSAATVPTSSATKWRYGIGSVSSGGVPVNTVLGSISHSRNGNATTYTDYWSHA